MSFSGDPLLPSKGSSKSIHLRLTVFLVNRPAIRLLITKVEYGFRQFNDCAILWRSQTSAMARLNSSTPLIQRMTVPFSPMIMSSDTPPASWRCQTSRQHCFPDRQPNFLSIALEQQNIVRENSRCLGCKRFDTGVPRRRNIKTNARH